MKKKENKTMKKVLTVSALALLLGLVGYTGGSTFAKYVSTEKTVSATATVAKWGLTAKADANALFGNAYNDPDGSLAKVTTSSDGLVVKGLASDNKVVAPGTTGSVKITFDGQAEVDAEVTFTCSINDISLKKDGSSIYDPIKWSVKKNGTEVVTPGAASLVDAYFAAEKIQYNAGAAVISDYYEIVWSWAFDNTDIISGELTGNHCDTMLAQTSALPTGFTKDVEMGIDLSVTFTQNQDTSK